MTDIETKCRMLFNTPDGKDVLFYIMEHGMMFDHCTTPEEMGRNNLAKEIMAMAMSFDSTSGGKDYSTTRSRRMLEWLFKRFNKEKKK